jgi:UDP:flavonoid glycosyltransferase YjiC (YdhE family)
MRILVAVQPVRSHFHSLAPLALAARSLGHEVGIASGPSMEPLARGLGLDLVPCGLDLRAGVDPTVALSAKQRAALAGAPTVVQHLVGFSAGMAPSFVRDLLERGPEWHPDLIIREPVEFGSVIAAERWRLPYATVMWAIYIDPRFLMREAYAQVIGDFGVDSDTLLDGFDRYLVIRSLPPEWQIAMSPDPPSTRSYAVPPFDASVQGMLPEELQGMPPRPRVWVTLGLSFSHAPDVFRAVIDALGDLDIEVIVTTGLSLDPGMLGPVPENIHLASYIPGNLLLPHCDAIVFHGGFNTLHAALWHGLPSVIVPLEGGDQLPSAEHVAELGLGLHVPGPVPSVEGLRQSVERVLEEPSFTTGARGFQARMRALPPLDVAIADLERLVGGQAPQERERSAPRSARSSAGASERQ